MSNKVLKITKLKSAQNKDFCNLQQQYETEFAPITGYKANEEGLFDQEFLISTWSKQGYDIYLLEINNSPSGFAVVNLSSMISHDLDARDIAEFFVIPKLRKQNIGTEFAQKIFKKYPGKWEVRQLPSLEKARRFWLKAIQACEVKDFHEETNNPNWEGFVQRFTV